MSVDRSMWVVVRRGLREDVNTYNRLNKLKDVEYITINAKTGKKSRAHVAYALTQSGVEPVDTLDVPTLLEKVENQFAA